jgi:tetratricopeptide (TPR) repeat protein
MTAAFISTLLMILVLQQPDTQQTSAYQVPQKTTESQLETNLPETTEPVAEMRSAPESTVSQTAEPEPAKAKTQVRSRRIHKQLPVADPEPVEQIETPILEEQNLNPPMSASTQRVLELNDKQRVKRGRYLNSKGFSLIKEGRPAEAIPLLEQSIRAFPQRTKDVTYAYALFNLGVAYRMLGRPDIAIPILEERIKIDNQREVVQRELMVARRQAHKSGSTKNQYN